MDLISPDQAGIIDEVQPVSVGTLRAFVADEDKFKLTRFLDFLELKHTSQ